MLGLTLGQHAKALPSTQHSSLLGLCRATGKKGTAEQVGTLEVLFLGEGEQTPGQAYPWLQTIRVLIPLSILDSMALTT